MYIIIRKWCRTISANNSVPLTTTCIWGVPLDILHLVVCVGCENEKLKSNPKTLVTHTPHNPDSCLYCTPNTHHTHTVSDKTTTPFVAVPLTPGLPGSFAAPGHGDHGRDHHNIVFIGTTQLFFLCLLPWLYKVLVML